MNILTFISGFDGCGYYRAAVPSLALNKYPGVVARIQTAYSEEALDWADLIIMQKQYKDEVRPWLKLAKEKKKPVIYEADDDYFNLPSWNPTAKWFQENKEKWLWFIKNADALIVSTEYLKNQYLKYNPNIYVLENGINFDIIDKLEQGGNPLRVAYKVDPKRGKSALTREEIIKSKADGYIHIGWGGSPTHHHDLALIQDLLLGILSKYSTTKLFHIGYTLDFLAKKAPKDRFFMIEGVDVDKYLPLLHFLDLDIGVAPLVDNVFNRSKSNLKSIEYMALKTAVIASDVENYSKTLRRKNVGFLCAGKKDWKKALENLIKKASLRKEIQNNGYNLARENYNSYTQAEKRLKIYRELINDG